ncbi:MAG TPA: urease accessory protein UreD [Nitrosospira sp.]|nr:urease accessory protein UreD [Nitrosospira sp.]
MLADVPLQARLSLKFAEDNGTTRLVEQDHFGPLLVQKPLYPEGREVCQAVIIHPPGGVVGGDKLDITARIDASARAQITTPGAAKWYKSNGHVSHQDIKLYVGSGGSLEWVPQETIFFDNADVVLDHEVILEKEAAYIGCEILCFGRTASGESFNGGQIRQRTSIRSDGKLIWFEQLRLLGGGPAMKGVLALSGKTVCATLISTGKAVPGQLIDSAREGAAKIANGTGHVGASQLKSVVVARYLGDSSETARRIMLHVWGLLRPAMIGRPAIVPRMWNT